MKKILIVINTMGHAGAETALLELLKQFDPNEHEVSLYVLMGQGEMIKRLPPHVSLLNKTYSEKNVLSKEGKSDLRKTVIKALLKRGCVFRLLPYIAKNMFAMIGRGQLFIDKLLWRVLSDSADVFDKEYDLAIAYLEGGSTYYVADHVKARRKAAFVHVDYEKAGYTRSLDKNCYTSFDRIFTVSEEVKKTFNKIYPECEGKTEIFHNILDTEGIRQKALLGDGFTDEFDGLRILSIGRLTKQKAFEVSIDAMKILKDRGEHIKWYVLGEGDQRKFLEDRVDKLGLKDSFLMQGQVDNPYPYLRQADIYVHASKFEGKSIAVQEAQILGKAIVVSDCSGNREQVIQNVDGILCDFDAESVANAIQELISNPVKRDGLGKAAAQKNEAQANEMVKIYNLLEG